MSTNPIKPWIEMERMSLHAGVYAGFAHPAIPDRYDRPAVSPPLAARRRADRRTQRIPPNGPVLAGM